MGGECQVKPAKKTTKVISEAIGLSLNWCIMIYFYLGVLERGVVSGLYSEVIFPAGLPIFITAMIMSSIAAWCICINKYVWQRKYEF